MGLPPGIGLAPVVPRNPRNTRKSAGSRSAGDLRRTQRDFLATRNTSFGRPGYDLKKVMQERLQRLNAMDS